MRRTVDHLGWNRSPRHLRGRIEQPELEFGGEQAAERNVDLRLLDQAAPDGEEQIMVGASAIEIAAHPDGEGGRFRRIVRHPVMAVEIVDRPAVAHDMAGEPPILAQSLFQQETTAATRLAVEAVVGAHHRLHACLHEAGEAG